MVYIFASQALKILQKVSNLVLIVCPGDGHTAQLVHNQPVHVRVADASTKLLLEEHQNVLRHLQVIF